jgi:hypothetical protein
LSQLFVYTRLSHNCGISAGLYFGSHGAKNVSVLDFDSGALEPGEYGEIRSGEYAELYNIHGL